MDDLFFISSFLISVTFYCIGRFEGERIIKKCFDEAVKNIQIEKEEWDIWIKSGRKVNQIPKARFGLKMISGHSDYKFKVSQQMGEDIKKLISKQEE